MVRLELNRWLHAATGRVFRRAGFLWEERRAGEHRLGLWRVPLKKKLPLHVARKRVVLIPGFGDSPLSWLSVFLLLTPRLRKKYDEVIFMDLPGYGGYLAKDPVFSSMEAMQDAVFSALNELKPEAIVGHSLGGWLTGAYAANGGHDQLTHIVCVCPAGVERTPEEIENFKMIFERAMTEGFSALRPHLFAQEPKWFSWMAEEFDSFMVREDVVSFLRSVSTVHSIEAKIPLIRARVTTVWGASDTLTPMTWAEVWDRAPGACSFFVLGAGHSPHAEKPRQTADFIAQGLGLTS